MAVLLGITILVGTACGTTAPPAPPPPPPLLPVAVDVPADTAALVAADDRFGVDLLTAPGVPATGNLAMSPASVAVALQMVAAGARGATAAQLSHVLHLPSAAAAATSAQALLAGLSAAGHDSHTTLRVANTVWAQRGMTLAPAYRDVLNSRFGAAMHTADFQADPAGARQAVNRTVAGQTGGMVPELFPPGSLDSSTRMVLADAVYLAASWARAFPVRDTAPGPFTLADGSVVRVPMMHAQPAPDAPAYGFAAGPGYQAVTLPYTGGKLAFTMLLPTGTSLTPVLDALRDNGLPAILRAVRPSGVSLAMPRFAVRSALDLTTVLAGLGMPVAFSDAADFGGISGEPLRIQTVRHDAVVRVDEHGTTAAAATGVGMQASAAVVSRVVTVDHPFLFVITDIATGAPLFLGRITDPR
ncbi:MAG TPA: serpin family protein [Pseudonocardiaceae bacterium]|nr:serpin family protein [Pseudonocardiaceae bacterium]